MTAPHLAYQQHRANEWYRIDMLLALYDAAIRNVDAAIAAASRGDADLTRKHRHKALRIVLELYAGLDLSYGEVPQRVAQLCEFMQHVLLTSESPQLASVRTVLRSLQEGFREIRAEAIALERAGKIPGVDSDGVHGGITA